MLLLTTAPTLHVTGLESPALEVDLTGNSEFQRFQAAAAQGNVVPLFERIMADQLTPVLAYRCLVKEDDRQAPSFLFESVVNGDQQVRSGHEVHGVGSQTIMVPKR